MFYLVQIVGILLSDRSPGVVGAAAAAFSCVCPNSLSLIARNYQRLCVILPDVEEWGQIILIGILLRYVIARHGLVEDSIMFTLHHTEKSLPERHGPEPETRLALFEDNGDLSWNYKSEIAYMVSKCYIDNLMNIYQDQFSRIKLLLNLSRNALHLAEAMKM